MSDSFIQRRRARSAALFAATCAVPLSSIARADPPSSSYRLMFADEFNGTSLDTSKWSAASPGWTMPNSDSVASANNVSVANGNLTLTATRPSATGSFSSGSVSSYNKFTFTSGYMEARIDLPSTVGSWPAFWGLYTGWPPEADVMEYPLTTNGGVSGLANNQYNTNYHYTNTAGSAAAGAGVVSTGSDLSQAYHTFGVSWVAGSSMTFYLDGVAKNSYAGSSVSQMAYMYMILDYAVGGWPGTPSLAQWAVGHTDATKVDWVRIWQTTADTPTSWNVNGGGSFAAAGNWTAGVPKFGNQVATFGRVGTSSTAAVTMSPWQVFGGITFDGTAGGTTAYTLGSSANQIQLATTSGSGVTVQTTAAGTASQTINANIELWSNTNFVNNMTGGQPLIINGNLSGAGNLNVDGVGTVILSGSGTYAGTTTIGSAAGPAVLRANADSALSTGTVTIGTSGNGTTARLEITGGHTLPNPIDFRGRNTNSVGIESISGNNTLSGTIAGNVGGGTLQIQSDANTLTLAPVSGAALTSASGNRIFTLQGAGNGIVLGNITDGAGTVGLVKAGNGTWTLSGSNPYSGATSVSGGNLILNNVGVANTSGVSISSGAKLTAKGSNSLGGTLTSSGTVDLADGILNTLTVKGGLALTGASFNVDLGSSTSDRVAALGSASGASGNVINIRPVLGQSMVPGASYTVLTATAGLNAASFSVGTKPASLGFFTFNLATPTATALLVNVAGSPVPTTAYWTGKGSIASGDGSNNWGAGAGLGTSNWSTNSAGTFDAQQLPGSTTNVILTAANAVASAGSSTTLLDSNYTVQGLSVDVPAAPGITLTTLVTNGNSLTIGGNGLSLAASSNSSATLSGTGSILLNGSQNWGNNNSSVGLNVNSAISALAGATTLTFNGTGTGGVNLAAVLSDGAGTLSTVFNQAGTTMLSASATYTGTTTVSGGTLQINNTGQIASDTTIASGATLFINGGTDAIGDANAVTVLSGGALDIRAGGGITKTETLGSLNGAGIVTRSNLGITTLTLGSQNMSGSFAGTLQNGTGTLALVKAGPNTQVLSGSSTYTGGTTINDAGGALLITSGAALGTGNITIGNGGNDQSGVLQLAGNIAVTSVPTINLSSRSTSDLGGAPQIENVSGNNSITANLNINNTGGSAVNILSDAGKLTLGGSLSSTGLTSARGFDFYGAGDGQVTGIISNGTSQPTFVQMDGQGTWTLTRSNTFTGGITVNDGTLALTGSNNFGGGGIVANGGVTVLSANNIYTGGTTIDSGTVIMASPSALGSGTINLVNGGISGGGTVVVQTDGGDTHYNINVGSGNELTLISDVKTGSIGINHTLGTLAIGRLTTVNVLAGTNVGTGAATITLGNATLSSGVGAGTTTFNPTTANLVLGAVTTSTASAKTIDLDGTSTGNAINGAITDGANVITLVKSNSSTWTLAGPSTFTGGTTINDAGGALLVTNSKGLGNGSVIIGSGNSNQTGVLQLAGNIAVTTVPSINFASRLLSNTGGFADIENVSGNNSLSATLNINNTGGNGVNILSTAGKLTLSGNLTSTGLSSARGFNFYGSGDGQVTGVISNGTAQPTFIQKDGLGTWTLSGTNTYTGNTTVDAGTLSVTNASNTASGVFILATGSTLNLASFSNYGVASAMGNRTAASDTNSATDSNTTGIGLHFVGGTLQYTGSSAQSTNRQIRLGTAGGAIDASGTVPAATLSFTYNGTNTNLFDTAGTRTLTLTGTNTSNNLFALNLTDQSPNATSLAKTGTGKWVLSNTSTFSGNTIINAGTLDVTGALPNSTAINVTSAGPGANLVLDAANAVATSAAITATGPAPTVTANAGQTFASLASTGTTTFAAGSSTITAITGTGSIGISSGANLTTASLRHGGLSINAAGSVTVAFDNQSATGGTPTGTSAVTTLSVDAAGTLDLTNNGIIVTDTTQFGAIQSSLATAYAAGWVSPGITSSTAAAHTGDHGVGYGLASAIGSTSFNGITFADAVIARYTLLGDTNLKGGVDLGDYTKVITNLGKTGTVWSDGNFDYSGTVGLGDYTKVILALGRTDATAVNTTAGPSAKQVRAASSALTLKAAAAIPAATATDVHLVVNTASGLVTLISAVSGSQAIITAYTVKSPSGSLVKFKNSGSKYLGSAFQNNPGVFYSSSNGNTYNNWTGIKNTSTIIGEGFGNNYIATNDTTWTNYTLSSGGYALGAMFKTLSAGGVQDLSFQWDDKALNTFTSVVDYVGGTVPEPTSVSLIAMGAVGLLGRRRRRSLSK